MNDSTAFEVTIDERPQGSVAVICGEANNDRAMKVREALAGLLARRTERVVIDLRQLHFIASMTLAELIHFRREIHAYGGRLRLAGASGDVMHVLKTTHLADLFPIYATPEEALRA